MLSRRDDQVVQLVGTFGQLTSSQLAVLEFSDVSMTPLDRCLKRLTTLLYLRRIGRAQPDPDRGGAGAFTYQIGLAGHRYLNRHGKWRQHVIHPHDLSVADVFVNLVLAQRAGKLLIGRFAKEVNLGKVRADIELAITSVDGTREARYYCEVDQGWQRPHIIQAKLQGYLKAWDESDADKFPRVVFLASDLMRVRELRFEIAQLRKEDRELFSASLLTDFPPTS